MLYLGTTCMKCLHFEDLYWEVSLECAALMEWKTLGEPHQMCGLQQGSPFLHG